MKSLESLYQERKKNVWQFYCPHCKSERRIPYRSRPGSPMHIFQVILTAMICMLLTWPWMAWKGVVVVFPLWVVFEIYYRINLRSLIACERCGFDPYLFLQDNRLAKKEIEQYWARKCDEIGVAPLKKDDVVAALRKKYGLPQLDESAAGKTANLPEDFIDEVADPSQAHNPD